MHFHNSNYMTSEGRQNHRYERDKWTSGMEDVKGQIGRAEMIFRAPRILLMMDIHHYTFAQTYRLYDTKDESEQTMDVG